MHIDLDAFFCAVEVLLNPDLEGKAFAVGGKSNRGVVTSCSYAARQFGVRSAMPMARAIQLCPHLIGVSSTRGEYSKRSKEVMDIVRSFTTEVEQISVDEAFLDVSDIIQTSVLYLSKKIQGEIYKKTGLPASLGLASNKLVAKIANDVGKASTKTNSYPMAIKIIEPGFEKEFLSPLPAVMLWGIGPKTAIKLEELGMFTIGDIANWPVNDLVNRFGQHGYSMSLKSKGIDNRSINKKRNSKSISQERTFFEDVSDENLIKKTIYKQSSQVGNYLKKSNKKGTTVKIKIRTSDFYTVTRQKTLEKPTDDPKIIYAMAKELFFDNWNKGRLIRLIGVGVSNFENPNKQLSLWDSADHIKNSKILDAIEKINKRFGNDIIFKGSK